MPQYYNDLFMATMDCLIIQFWLFKSIIKMY